MVSVKCTVTVSLGKGKATIMTLMRDRTVTKQPMNISRIGYIVISISYNEYINIPNQYDYFDIITE